MGQKVEEVMLVVFSSCLIGAQNLVKNYLQPSQIYQVNLLHALCFMSLVNCFASLIPYLIGLVILCSAVGKLFLNHLQSL